MWTLTCANPTTRSSATATTVNWLSAGVVAAAGYDFGGGVDWQLGADPTAFGRDRFEHGEVAIGIARLDSLIVTGSPIGAA